MAPHMNFYRASTIIVYILVEISLKIEAGLVYGEFRGSNSWEYLSRFCYSASSDNEEELGILEIDVMYPSISSPDILIYYLHDEDNNEFDKWATIYGSELTCNERSIAADERYSVKRFQTATAGQYARAKLLRRVQTRRPRWVFITMGNCGKVCKPNDSNSTCMSGLDISYKISFINPGKGFDEFFSFFIAT